MIVLLLTALFCVLNHDTDNQLGPFINTDNKRSSFRSLFLTCFFLANQLRQVLPLFLFHKVTAHAVYVATQVVAWYMIYAKTVIMLSDTWHSA